MRWEDEAKGARKPAPASWAQRVREQQQQGGIARLFTKGLQVS